VSPADQESSYRAIESLIALYAELVDDGDAILARISAASRTNCETLEPWRLAASWISCMPSRVKLIVVRVIGMAKSCRRGPQGIGR
jgi:hypothetical protein